MWRGDVLAGSDRSFLQIGGSMNYADFFAMWLLDVSKKVRNWRIQRAIEKEQINIAYFENQLINALEGIRSSNKRLINLHNSIE
jgi:hypothetical protein